MIPLLTDKGKVNSISHIQLSMIEHVCVSSTNNFSNFHLFKKTYTGLSKVEYIQPPKNFRLCNNPAYHTFFNVMFGDNRFMKVTTKTDIISTHLGLKFILIHLSFFGFCWTP